MSGVAPGNVGRAGHPPDGEQVIGAVRLRAGDVHDEIRSRRPRCDDGRRGYEGAFSLGGSGAGQCARGCEQAHGQKCQK